MLLTPNVQKPLAGTQNKFGSCTETLDTPIEPGLLKADSLSHRDGLSSQIHTVIWKSHASSPDARVSEPLAKFPGNAKPDIDVRIRRIIVIAIRRRSVPSIVIERAATQHPGN